MTKPQLWMRNPGAYQYRVQFRFVNEGGTALKTKTWELSRNADDPTQVHLLQAEAQLASRTPQLQELGRNYVAITIVVSTIVGELITYTSLEPVNSDPIKNHLAAYHLTIGVETSRSGLRFFLYTAKPRPSS
jgi:hypothetical protein